MAKVWVLIVLMYTVSRETSKGDQALPPSHAQRILLHIECACSVK
jgi:hypothetical protein